MKKVALVVLVLVLSALAGVTAAYAANDEVTLEYGLAWLLSGGGAGVITYLLMDKVPYLKKQAPDYKRYWSIGLVFVLVMGGWGLTMLMGYSPIPETWREGVEMAFSIGFVGLTTSLVVHGATDLRQRRIAQQAE